MVWFARCGEAQINMSSAGTITYRGRVLSNECMPPDRDGYDDLAIEAYTFAAKMNQCQGGWSISSYDDAGLLDLVTKNVSKPILEASHKAQCLIWFLPETENFSGNFIEFQVLLPRVVFEKVGEIVRHHVFGGQAGLSEILCEGSGFT